MSESRKIFWLIWLQALAARTSILFIVGAFVCAFASVASAIDVPTPAEVIGHANQAGAMSASAVWALFAATLVLGQVALGFFIFKAQTAVDAKLAIIAVDIAAIKAAKPICAGSDAIHAVLNTARTELERAGNLIRNGK